jgi:hypothetical protein
MKDIAGWQTQYEIEFLLNFKISLENLYFVIENQISSLIFVIYASYLIIGKLRIILIVCTFITFENKRKKGKYMKNIRKDLKEKLESIINKIRNQFAKVI